MIGSRESISVPQNVEKVVSRLCAWDTLQLAHFAIKSSLELDGWDSSFVRSTDNNNIISRRLVLTSQEQGDPLTLAFSAYGFPYDMDESFLHPEDKVVGHDGKTKTLWLENPAIRYEADCSHREKGAIAIYASFLREDPEPLEIVRIQRDLPLSNNKALITARKTGRMLLRAAESFAEDQTIPRRYEQNSPVFS